MTDDSLRAEHAQLRAEARQGRAAFTTSPASVFVREMTTAMTEYQQMRRSGLTREDACRGIEEVLRQVWPHSVTKFPPKCETCDDTGWRQKFCTDALRCGRRWCAGSHAAHEHTYVEPCGCEAGDRHTPKVHTPESDIAAVGRMKKRTRGWTRFGT